MITHYGLFRESAPNSPMIKEAKFFASQGGLTDTWGKGWEPIYDEKSIGDARRKFASDKKLILSSIYDGET